MFIDSHCHLDFEEFSNQLDEILLNMKNAQVDKALCISVDVVDYPKVLALASNYVHLYATVGVHPDYEDTIEPTKDWLVQQAKHPKVVAIGETGLDYYRMNDRPYASLDWQRDRFRTHIAAAIESQKPLIIHTRSASEDTIRILKEEGADQVGGVMHCFTESKEVAKAAMDLGFYISFSGIVTFKNALEIKETCQFVPLDRLLIETDSPYLAPVPHRGKTNQPAWVSHVAEYVAQLKGVSVEQIGQTTSHNFHQLFKI
ncbi:deoxyribonuclease [Polynucleobacter sp. SHI8]|uniref:TatD family hydrolase n=1 Tax=unclassified Polynucleobacter TaxID=2640945 RepID=UPI00248F54C2|nr:MULTISPECIES: TatD family hydrolase [unclassified Polynucleobacter]BDW11112.1 deoxyribonuclease [Polynucleobacter sp. SHI2]BDW13558.1 deoxyribonuclease [Polynucleobacter sp. SHI8]